MSRHTLLFRLAGPMQSWGTTSRFIHRDAGLEPSKSGVIGLLAAALGRARTDDVSDLARLRLGVRVDREGVSAIDYQTAGAGRGDPGVARANAGGRGPVVSRRSYLMDAVFLIGLEGGDATMLAGLDAALRAPVWPLALGRRSYVPGCPVPLPQYAVRHDTSLREALLTEPWPVAELTGREQPDRLRLVLESDEATGTVRQDQPVGAAFATRVFGSRSVATEMIPLSDLPIREVSGV